MQSDAATVEDYLATLPDDRREALSAVRDTVNANLDDGFAEGMEYGMVTWGGDWFRQQYVDRGMRLDMGKSCVRFKSLDEVPLDVLAALLRNVTPEQHVTRYEESRALTRKGR